MAALHITRTEYIQKWHRFQQRHEEIYRRKFQNALQAQVHQFFKHHKVHDVTADPIYKVLVELYKTVGPLWAAHTGVHRIKEQKALAPMGFSERIVELMRTYYGIDLLNDAELMTEKSREYIAAVLSEAAQSGATFDWVVKQLTTRPEFTAMRARRIARTETVTSANGAAIINAKESKLLMNKEWLSVQDKRTRHDHRQVNGSVVAIDAPFHVGDSLMAQPGVRTQTNGLATPAAEVVNCRCTVAFIPVRDGDGRLVRT